MVLRVAKENRRVEIWVTVVGQVRAGRRSPSGPCDPVLRGHYGHLGAFPAQLVVKRMDEIVIKENPGSDIDYRVYLNPKSA